MSLGQGLVALAARAGQRLRQVLGGEAAPLNAPPARAGTLAPVALPEGAVPEGAAPADTDAAVRRWREAFAEQAAQVAQLQRQAQLDGVSGLPLRRHFVVLLQQRLAEPGGPAVALLLVRVLQLEALNLRLGHEATDRLLGAVADMLQTYVDRVPGTFAGRMNGTDFALCLPVPGVAAETAESLRAALAAAPALRVAAAEVVVGGADGLHDTSASAALACADVALAQAEAGTEGVALLPALETHSGAAADALGARAWREQISAALAERRTQLAELPVRDGQGQELHLECPLRVQLKPGGDYQAAERWLALARRSRLMPQVDLAAVELALRAIAQDGHARAVHASPLSLTTPGFIADVAALLRASPGAARRLLIECVDGLRPAAGTAPLAAAAAAWRPCGARVGVEHAAASVQLLPALQAAGVQYIKLDARHLQALGTDAAVRGYAQGLVALVHGLGMTVLATGVAEAADLPALWELGFDGASGPALDARATLVQPA